MVQINLLPWREQERQAKQVRFGILLIAFLIMAFLFVVGVHIYFKGLIKIQNDSNNFLKTTLDESQAELTTLKEKKQAQITLISQLHYIIGLREKSYQAVNLLNTLARTVPDTIILDKVLREGNTVSIAGIAQANSEVTQFMKNISTYPGFEQPVLTGITSVQGPNGDERHFQIKIVMK